MRLLLRQIDASIKGAVIARKATGTSRPSHAERDEMKVIEHTGDEARASLVTSVAAALVTPLDREDLFRISRSIDDVLDNFRDFVRELDMFQAADDLFIPVIDAVMRGLERLHEAIEAVTDAPDEVPLRTLATKKSCNEIRRSYEQQMAILLRGDVTPAMLRRRELLRRLDVVGLRLGEAADALADAAIKRTL